MPYQGDQFSMFIFLPPSTPTAIDDLLAELTPATLYDVFKIGFTHHLVDVEFPKISLEYKPQIIPVY